MPRPHVPIAAVVAATLLTLLLPTRSLARIAAESDDLSAGLSALERRDGSTAVTHLEAALLAVESEQRTEVLSALRKAYELAASQAESAGDPRRARAYRENLLIIDRTNRRSPRSPSSLDETQPQPSHALIRPADPKPEPDETPPAPDRSETDSRNLIDNAAAQVPSLDPGVARTSTEEESPPSPAPSSSPRVLIRQADNAFRDKQYENAGRIYARLAERGELPESHKAVWAYCRCIDVVRRINEAPKSPSEWSEIHAEIRAIRALAPGNWFSEYLRTLAAERSAAAGAQPSGYVVRGQSDSIESTTSSPSDRDRATSSTPNLGDWKVLKTENFRIFHDNPELAAQIGRQAEATRLREARRWSGSDPAGPWTPPCDIYVYPTAEVFRERTGQPEESPGFSTMGLNGGRVIARRINLRADYPEVVEAVLPHEVTHVVLADLFPTLQIPRWADEGIAVMAEPAEARRDLIDTLDESLSTGRLFRVQTLMTAEFPDGRYWDLYIAQSASITRFLLEQGTPPQLIAFLQGAQRNGIEAELRRIYQIDGYDDLQTRWLSYARRSSPPPAEIAARSTETEERR